MIDEQAAAGKLQCPSEGVKLVNSLRVMTEKLEPGQTGRQDVGHLACVHAKHALLRQTQHQAWLRGGKYGGTDVVRSANLTHEFANYRVERLYRSWGAVRGSREFRQIACVRTHSHDEGSLTLYSAGLETENREYALREARLAR